jgi:hypothetical protein
MGFDIEYFLEELERRISSEEFDDLYDWIKFQIARARECGVIKN